MLGSQLCLEDNEQKPFYNCISFFVVRNTEAQCIIGAPTRTHTRTIEQKGGRKNRKTKNCIYDPTTTVYEMMNDHNSAIYAAATADRVYAAHTRNGKTTLGDRVKEQNSSHGRAHTVSLVKAYIRFE